MNSFDLFRARLAYLIAPKAPKAGFKEAIIIAVVAIEVASLVADAIKKVKEEDG